MSEIVLTVEKREATGKQVSKRLRRQGRIPGVYYIHGEEAVPFSVDEKQVHQLLRTDASIVDLQFESGKKVKCILRDVQWHPLQDRPVHVDLMGVKMTEEIEVDVPIHLVGEPVGVKRDGGVLQQNVREITVQCLPGDIPEHLEVDISHLEVGGALHIADLELEKVKILNDPTQSIAVVVPPRVEVAPAGPEEEEGVEPEVVGEEKKEEGEAAAEEESGEQQA